MSPCMESKATCDGNRIIIPAQHYITTSLTGVLAELVTDMEDDRNKTKLIDFAHRLSQLYSMRLMTRTDSLRAGFEMFCGECTRASEAFMKADDVKGTNLKMKEDEFIEDFHKTLDEGNFLLLSNDYYETAIASDFEVPLSMEMDAARLDSSFIERLHHRHRHRIEFKQAAPVTKQILIYHRGIGQAHRKGFFALEKADHLIALIFSFFLSFFWIFKSIYKKIKRKFRSQKSKRKKDVKPDSKKTDAIMSDDDEESDSTSDSNDSEEETSTKPSVDRSVYRLTLDQALKQDKMNFFHEVELAEPTFKELIVIYRDIPQAEPSRGERKLTVPKIKFKSYRDIPIADFEAVLPAQIPKQRASDTLKMLFALLGGIFAVYRNISTMDIDIWTSSFQDTLKGVWQTLTIVGAYVTKLYFQKSASERKYTQVITTYLYDKSMNNDAGILPYIVDSTLQQEVKEAVIAYYFLWSHQAQTRDELDEVCEVFLDQIEDSVDFEAEDGLRKLILEDIVRSDEGSNEDSHLFHLNMSRAIQNVQHKISAFHEDQDRLCPYCPILHPLGENC